MRLQTLPVTKNCPGVCNIAPFSESLVAFELFAVPRPRLGNSILSVDGCFACAAFEQIVVVPELHRLPELHRDGVQRLAVFHGGIAAFRNRAQQSIAAADNVCSAAIEIARITGMVPQIGIEKFSQRNLVGLRPFG